MEAPGKVGQDPSQGLVWAVLEAQGKSDHQLLNQRLALSALEALAKLDQDPSQGPALAVLGVPDKPDQGLSQGHDQGTLVDPWRPKGGQQPDRPQDRRPGEGQGPDQAEARRRPAVSCKK